VATHLPTIKIKSLRGGRNGSDPPDEVLDLQCVAAINVDWYRATFGRKRPGSDNVNLAGGTVFNGNIDFLYRHVPGADETAAELWGIDDEVIPIVKRLTAGTAWADVTLDDPITGNTPEISAVTFNGKLWLAHKSSQDRLHVYDPADAKVRRAGFATPAVPTTGAPAAGAVTDTRTVKIAWIKQVAGVTVRRSELSSATAPVVLVAQQFVITRSTAPGEGETHWEVYEAGTDGLYYRQSIVAIATLTYADNSAALTTTTIAPTVGINTPFPSVKYLTTDGNRILGAGSYATGGFNSRVWFSPVLGTNDIGDDERYVNTTTQKNYVDLNENDGGYISALSPPLDGSIYAFKYRQIHKLTPTGDVTQPYDRTEVSRVIGCIDHRSLRIGEDQKGNSALYFMATQGPYRLGRNGLEYLGHDLEDLLPVNISATTKAAFTEYYPALRQLWMWVATGSNNAPDKILVFHPLIGTSAVDGVHGGWSVYTGNLAAARCACLFANTLGASMSKDLKPYVSRNTTNRVLKADSATAKQDDTTPYQAYILTKPYQPAGESNKFQVFDPLIVAEAANGVSVQVEVVRDDGVEAKPANVVLTPRNTTQTRVRKKVAGANLAGCTSVQYRVGDKAAVASGWRIDQIIAPYAVEEQAAA
jgi:hypothetical protein